ncbi:MAG TPA: hypothetical protein ENJ97_01430, partial [Planctomycetes bacterium]|nr:hypothetical protein [Planctomycetota bacterium]
MDEGELEKKKDREPRRQGKAGRALPSLEDPKGRQDRPGPPEPQHREPTHPVPLSAVEKEPGVQVQAQLAGGKEFQEGMPGMKNQNLQDRPKPQEDKPREKGDSQEGEPLFLRLEDTQSANQGEKGEGVPGEEHQHQERPGCEGQPPSSGPSGPLGRGVGEQKRDQGEKEGRRGLEALGHKGEDRGKEEPGRPRREGRGEGKRKTSQEPGRHEGGRQAREKKGDQGGGQHGGLGRDGAREKLQRSRHGQQDHGPVNRGLPERNLPFSQGEFLGRRHHQGGVVLKGGSRGKGEPEGEGHGQGKEERRRQGGESPPSRWTCSLGGNRRRFFRGPVHVAILWSASPTSPGAGEGQYEPEPAKGKGNGGRRFPFSWNPGMSRGKIRDFPKRSSRSRTRNAGEGPKPPDGNPMEYDFSSILRRFALEGEPRKVEPFGSGHIHETFAVTNSAPGGEVHYILQRINKNIFPEPEPLQENIQRVTAHLEKKLRDRGVPDYRNRVLRLFPALDGKTYYVDETGHFWRVYNKIEGGRTYDRLENLDQAFQAAKAFGLFQADLQDLPGPPLHEILPRFHDGPWRHQQFRAALESDPMNRAAKAREEIAFLEENAGIFQVLPRLQAEGKIPVRVTHNDTKINNVVLSDATGEALAVIDLDTVMPGLSLFDFGDIVRTTVSDSDEDEMDLEKVRVDLDRFSAVLR